MRRPMRVGSGVAIVVLASMVAGDARAQGAPPPAPPPGEGAPPGAAPPPPGAPPPEAWFPQLEGKRPPPREEPPPEGGAYVIEPSEPPPSTEPPPEPSPDVAVTDEEYEGIRDGGLVMGMLAVRPFGTYLDGGPIPYVGEGGPPDRSSGVVAGHVGIRGHGTGIDDDFIGRADVEAFVGASTEGVEGEGKAFLSFGLATPIERIHFLFFRFGVGGTLFGNPLLDYQAADLPALELGYVHVGADGFIEVAPRVAMGLLAIHTGERDALTPDPAPAFGGRLLAGADALWAAADYEIVTAAPLPERALGTAQPVQFAYLTACYAQKFSFCLDGKLMTAATPGGDRDSFGSRLTALSGGISFGLGVAEQE